MINQRVLIIDGHPVYVNKTIGFLRGLTIKDIYLAKSGSDGLDMAQAKKPNLVILSGMLPDMDSLNVCKALHQSADNDARIIVQIGLFTEQDVIDQFKANGADVVLLRKEKDLQPLEEAINHLLFRKV